MFLHGPWPPTEEVRGSRKSGRFSLSVHSLRKTSVSNWIHLCACTLCLLGGSYYSGEVQREETSGCPVPAGGYWCNLPHCKYSPQTWTSNSFWDFRRIWGTNYCMKALQTNCLCHVYSAENLFIVCALTLDGLLLLLLSPVRCLLFLFLTQ